ncbi:MAG TPA: hypothetical protein VLT61_03925 [Anaeromyxobacteraceae bacterium]|nr:hypothetical protein [Anaeromyxobacteraceae bacterium]
MHLDPLRYAALIGGTLPPAEARALSDHLAGDCELCERFLAEAGADALDGRSDAAIVGAFPPPPVPGGELEFARIVRRMAAGAPRRRRFAVPFAIAASLLLAGLAGLWVQRNGPGGVAPGAGWDGVKGTAVATVQVRLRAVRLDADGAALPVHAGESLEPGARLLFEVTADRSAEVVLARVPPSGAAEIVWRSRVESGRTVVTMGGKAAAYPVAGLAGRQRFAALAAEGALDDAKVARATSALALTEAQGDGTAAAGVSVDVLDVSVR